MRVDWLFLPGLDAAQLHVPGFAASVPACRLAAATPSNLSASLARPQVSKRVVGRLRPNFLSLCEPVPPNPVTASYGQPAADNPACTAAESGELTDAHYR